MKFKTIIFVGLTILLQSCVVNNTLNITENYFHKRQEGKSILIYGAKGKSKKHPNIHIKLSEYDLKKQRITGNCYIYNRVEATVPSNLKSIKYFLFEVDPGSYISNAPFNSVKYPLHLRKAKYFNAPSNSIVYIGDFNSINRKVEHNIDSASPVIEELKKYKNINEKLVIASPYGDRLPGTFVCTP